MTKVYHVKRTIKLIIGLMIYFLVLISCLSQWGNALDRFLSDFLFCVRGGREPPAESIIVAIDEPSFGVLQQQWPWPRSLHARLIERLFEAGAKLVAFDVVFAEPSIPEEDARLAGALAAHPNTLLAADFNVVNESSYLQEILVAPYRELVSASSPVGFVTLPVDGDGFVRRIHPRRGPLPAFSLAAALLFGGPDHAGKAGRFLNGKPLEDYDINFLGPPRTVRTVSYYQALDPAGHLPEGVFRGRMVFVGLVLGTAIEGRSRGQENFPVPFSRWGGGYMPGVEIHAQAAQNFLEGTLIRRLTLAEILPFCLFFGLPFSVLCLAARPLRGALILAGALIVFLGASIWLFASSHLSFPTLVCVLPPIGCYVVSPLFRYWEVWKEKTFIRKAFSTYLAPSVVGQVLSRPEQLRLGGEVVEATVLFLDVAGFTTLSEKVRPEDLIQVLNRYLGAFTEIVFRWDGMVDKFIGDAVMATWGVPIAQDDHAERACHAALEMQEIMSVLSREEVEKGTGLQLKIRIGISSGRMIAGNVGGERHFNYTVVGDEVNLASRLEGVNRYYGTVITISQNTARRVEGVFDLRELDYVRVKGRGEAVRIYELRGLGGTLTESRKAVDALYAQGRSLYEQGCWSEARALFEQAMRLDSEDGPCRCFINRCRMFEENPPGRDWDCAVSLDK
jgi:adenylate cyclase